MTSTNKKWRSDAALIKRAVANAVAEIQRIERDFHKTLQSIQKSSSSPARATKPAAVRTRAASVSSTVRTTPVPSSARRAAPVRSEITKVLKKRRRGLTVDGLREVLPQFDEKSLLNATFAMRRKGLITFEKSEKGRGTYRWQEQS
jgi:hypothetical protein